MKESIRQFKNIDDLIKELENRKLIFPDDESKEKFKDYLRQYVTFLVLKKFQIILCMMMLKINFTKKNLLLII